VSVGDDFLNNKLSNHDVNDTAPTGVVKLYLASIKDKLAKELKHDSLPMCYIQNQFWIYPADPFFAMRKAAHSASGLQPDPLYRPSVFVWLPHLLQDDKLTCPMPNCKNYKKSNNPLTIKGWNDNPIARRVVALDHVYYIITQRIQCATRNDGCGKSWNLYDPAIMEQLDHGLAASFPAFLTHRSGVDKTLMTLIRAGMAHRLSSSAWSNILRELHIRRHDLYELDYLQAIYREKKSAQCYQMYQKEKIYKPFSTFHDKDGYAGFYPSRWYINTVYMDYMEHIRPILDQCMASLSGYIIKWDHSFKLPKLLTKLNGVATFVALFTLVNEFEQIRYQAFVPTKSLSHICAGLEAFSKSLTDHGHPQPVLGFTDNVQSDAATFIRCIPSLGKDVVSPQIEDHPDFPQLCLPSNVSTYICESEAEIQSACDTILEALPDDPLLLHVGFDMEWDFSITQSESSRKTALVQIALPNTVYLLRICQLKRLPVSLQVILTNNRVIKIGRNVGGDLAKLAREFPEYQPTHRGKALEGVIELGAFAKAKNVVTNGNASLAAITAAALHFSLSKESRSTEWTASELSEDQKVYAALDAWVALEIWRTIKDNNTQGLALTVAAPVGQPVALCICKQEVAYGFISQQPSQFPIVNGQTGDTVLLNVSGTSTRALITITKVLAPKVELAWHRQTLEQLQSGKHNFDAVVSLSCLRTRSIEPAVHATSNILPLQQIDTSTGVILPPQNMSTTCNDADDNCSDTDDAMSDNSQEDDNLENDYTGYIQSSECETYPSRILGDVFHEIDRIGRTLSKKHSLHHAFNKAFSDTMLVPDKGDYEKVNSFLTKKALKWDNVRRSHDDWLWKRVRRYIPEKALLHHILEEFFNAWGNIRCTVRKEALFNAESWKKAKRLLHDVKKGWVSDPEGIPIYTLIGYDKNGLALYHSNRGTSSVEGGVHNPIRRSFGSLNASVELADCLIADFRHRHNLDVGTVHKTGSQYCGHYDTWLDHEITQLRGDIQWKYEIQADHRLQDTDPLSFAQSEEQFGIVGIPNALKIRNNFSGPEILNPVDQAENSGLLPRLSCIYPTQLHLSHLKGKRKDLYSYLASAQCTKIAVTPVHTESEFKLFHIAVSVGGKWCVSRREPDFDSMAAWWTSQADGITIFYKLREHLANYYKLWTERNEGRRTLAASETERQQNTQKAPIKLSSSNCS
jgi:hypothetical protein